MGLLSSSSVAEVRGSTPVEERSRTMPNCGGQCNLGTQHDALTLRIRRLPAGCGGHPLGEGPDDV